jgi:hypothetical protein
MSVDVLLFFSRVIHFAWEEVEPISLRSRGYELEVESSRCVELENRYPIFRPALIWPNDIGLVLVGAI